MAKRLKPGICPACRRPENLHGVRQRLQPRAFKREANAKCALADCKNDYGCERPDIEPHR